MGHLGRCRPSTLVAVSLTTVPEAASLHCQHQIMAQSVQQTALAPALFINSLIAVTASVHTLQALSLQGEFCWQLPHDLTWSADRHACGFKDPTYLQTQEQRHAKLLCPAYAARAG